MRLVLAISLTLFAGQANASTLFCEFTRSTGFMFEGGSWKSSAFYPEHPFALELDEAGLLSSSSAAKVVFGPEVTCKRSGVFTTQSCSSPNGDYLFFNTETLMGAVARTFGVAMGGPRRDTVSVEMFQCKRT